MGEALTGVGEAFAKGEFAQARVQQRLERVGQGPAEQLDGVGVDQLAQQRAATVSPVRREVLERPAGLFVFTNAEGAQRVRRRVAASAATASNRCFLAAQLPVRQPT